MKITDIGVIPIAMPLVARHHDRARRMRMYDMDQHVVVKVHTDNGLVGYGDYDYWGTTAPWSTAGSPHAWTKADPSLSERVNDHRRISYQNLRLPQGR